MKQHKLKTLTDIVAVVDKDNIDSFLVDFKGWLGLSVFSKEANELFKDQGRIEMPNSGEMTWIDDGKNDVTINVEVTSPSPE